MPTPEQEAEWDEMAARMAAEKFPPRRSHVSMSVFCHGVTGQNLIFTDDERRCYIGFAISLLKELTPVGIREFLFAQSIVDHHWRLRRLQAIENNLFHIAGQEHSHGRFSDDRLEWINASVNSWRRNGESFDRIGRYEQRVSRQLKDSYEALNQLQNHRPARLVNC